MEYDFYFAAFATSVRAGRDEIIPTGSLILREDSIVNTRCCVCIVILILWQQTFQSPYVKFQNLNIYNIAIITW